MKIRKYKVTVRRYNTAETRAWETSAYSVDDARTKAALFFLGTLEIVWIEEVLKTRKRK